MPDLDGKLLDAIPVGVIILDREGRVVAFNAHEEKYSGHARERVIGRSFFEEIAPCLDVREVAGRFREGVEAALDATHDPYETVFALPIVPEPRAVTVRLRSTVINGEPFGVLTIEDRVHRPSVDRLRRALEDLRHDLFSPLMVVTGTLDLLLDDPPVTNDTRRAALVDGMASAERVTRTLLGLFDIARFETGTLTLQPQFVEMGGLLRDIQTSSLEFLRTITIAFRDPELRACADVPLLRRALESLFDNAVQRTASHTPVVVRGAVEDGRIAIDVRDAGRIVPDDSRESVFAIGAVPLDETNRRLANLGLGLTFARLVARAHGGDVVVRPREDGRGAIFRLTLPVAPAP